MQPFPAMPGALRSTEDHPKLAIRAFKSRVTPGHALAVLPFLPCVFYVGQGTSA